MSFAAVVLWLLSPLSATAQPEHTTVELLSMSPGEANRTAQHDLLSLLQPTGKYRRGMLTRVRGIGLTTRPYGTEFQGVCRQDHLTLWYTGARSDAVPRNPEAANTSPVETPLQPYGFDAEAQFHIDRLPVPPVATSQVAAWQSACDPRRFNDETRWFTARDAAQAVLAANMFRMAEDQVKAGALKPEPCPSISNDRSVCAGAILAADDVTKFDNVEACDAPPESACLKIDLDYRTKMTIVARLDPNDHVTPNAITSIEVEEYVTVA